VFGLASTQLFWERTGTKDVHVVIGKEKEDSGMAKIRPPEISSKIFHLKSGSLEGMVPKAGL
jgi:hypothetical protein